MAETSKKPGQETHVSVKEAFPRERTAFKSLLLANPNYFGNLTGTEFQPVLELAGNTYYEQLGCVGYQPQQGRLEGVVYIYQPSGYGSDICGNGTPEFVRFYLSYDQGNTWQDQGLTSFRAYNIPPGTDGGKRLEYAVSLAVNPDPKFCRFDPLIRVRAILSWNNPPPPNQPDWTPVWGNVREANILVEPIRWIRPWELFEVEDIKLTPYIKEVLDLETPIPSKLKALDAVELSALYKEQDVPAHRFAFKELAAFASGELSLTPEAFATMLPGVEFKPDLFDLLFPKTDGDISYEELTCIGLDPNTPDTLVGVIHVKKGAGYSGGPCTRGSAEYVTFWADFDGNGTFETCLGTASVQVYDLTKIPRDGVHYAVRLPVDLNEYRQSCRRGPKVVRIRAILSWNQPVPCYNPSAVPTWGNREETLINIAPGISAPGGKIAVLGGIPVGHIDNSTGLTTSTAVFATNNLAPDAYGRPCPFAGWVTVQGAPLFGYSYKVEVTPFGGGAPTAVVTKLVLTRADGTTYTHFANPTTGRFTYVPFDQNINGVLAQWPSAGDDRWVVTLTTYDVIGNPVGLPDSHVIQLDNTWPEASIDITIGAGNCGKFGAGTPLSGRFVARDTYLSGYSLGIEPAVNTAPIGVVAPAAGSANTASAPGDAWSLDTTKMQPCGYVIRVTVSDRAIVNSQSVGHHASDSAGFCISDPGDDC